MTVALANATELFRANTAYSPSIFALSRAAEGSGAEGAGIVDFCIPCNPYFPSPAMFERLNRGLRDILTYYPSGADTIIAELSTALGLNPQTVAMGNGSTELITWIDHLLVKESLAIPIPAFGRWTDQPMETGKRVDMFLLPEAAGFALDPAAFVSFVRSRGSRTAVICNPNNPDGGYLPRHAVISMLDALSDLDLVIVDESFTDFVDAEAYPSVVDEASMRPNVVVLRSLGKNFGLHGIRFGYMVANPQIAGKIRNAVPKWNLNSFAEVVVFMIKEYRQEYQQSLRMLSRDRQEMLWQLSALPGMTVYPSQGNFVFVKLPDGVDGGQLRDRLLNEHGVVTRECGNKLGSSSRFMRLAVRSQPDVQRLLTGLSNVLYGSAWYAAQPIPEPQQAPPPPAPAPPAPQEMLALAPAPQPTSQPQPALAPAAMYTPQQVVPIPEPQPIYTPQQVMPIPEPQPIYEAQQVAPDPSQPLYAQAQSSPEPQPAMYIQQPMVQEQAALFRPEPQQQEQAALFRPEPQQQEQEQAALYTPVQSGLPQPAAYLQQPA